MKYSYVFVSLFIVTLQANKANARELTFSDAQTYWELGFDLSLALTGNAIISEAYSDPNRRGRRDFPTQNFDNYIRKNIHGEKVYEKETTKEKNFDMATDIGNRLVLTGALTTLWFEDENQRLGKYLTFIHSWAMWLVVSDTLKASVSRYRPRPFYLGRKIDLVGGPSTGSFPSGHSGEIFATTTALTLLSDLSLPYKIGLFSAATILSVSRIASEDHFFTDIVAGGIIGSTAAWGAYYLFEEKDWFSKALSFQASPHKFQVTYRF